MTAQRYILKDGPIYRGVYDNYTEADDARNRIYRERCEQARIPYQPQYGLTTHQFNAKYSEAVAIFNLLEVHELQDAWLYKPQGDNYG